MIGGCRRSKNRRASSVVFENRAIRPRSSVRQLISMPSSTGDVTGCGVGYVARGAGVLPTALSSKLPEEIPEHESPRWRALVKSTADRSHADRAPLVFRCTWASARVIRG
jgi:hypothetical protein